MERIQILIDKLVQQQQNGAAPSQLLVTVQLLQNELLELQRTAEAPVRSRVYVTMPTRTSLPSFAEAAETPAPAAPVPQPEPVAEAPTPVVEIQQPVITEVRQTVWEAPVPEPEPVVLPQPVWSAPEPEAPRREAPVPEVAIEEAHQAYLPKIGYTLRKPPVTEVVVEERKMPEPVAQPVTFEPEPEPQRIAQPQPVMAQPQPVIAQMHMPFEVAEEAPTLVQHRELHERIAEKRESLNDRLKQEKTEVVHKLKETPIRDLKKAIGVNDKFAFISELFRGDEAMYERSIKTINGFHILPEAEYWINRELKVKLGWNDSKELVQHFYHLVRRRFS
ncbi:MAG TPA: hypothetical protein VHK69_20285 [Chitinophagaceae bacterium]|jgi:hypothetical protein|nr:hypothetical protein [Chitinophagaceae bacterium]